VFLEGQSTNRFARLSLVSLRFDINLHNAIMFQRLVVAAIGLGQLATALPSQIELDYATFQGKETASTGTTDFLGMPFAVAGRLENPRLIGPQDALEGVQDATDYGPACPQQNLVASPLYQENRAIGSTLGFLQSFVQPVLRQSEDCLSINVQVPEGVNDTAGLPVLMWIHGGGFELGSSGSLGSEGTAVQGVIYQVGLT
jgi:carboxylesterase type B